MDRVDKKIIFITFVIVGLLCLAYAVINYLPKFSHHLLLVVASGLFFSGLSALIKYKSYSGWVEKLATLIKIEEGEEEIAISEYTRIKYYYPIAEYEYAMDGVKHIGNVVSFEKENVWVPEVDKWGTHTPQKLRWWLSLKAGDKVPVFVNPKNSRQSVLIKTVAKERRSHYIALLFGGIVICLIWLAIEVNAMP